MIRQVKNWLLKSMQGRLTLASVLVLPLICGFLAWTLDRAFTASLLASQKNQMISQVYALIAAAELDQGSLWLPEYVTDDRLNQLSSEIYALVLDEDRKELIWQSLSTQMSLSDLGFNNDLVVGKPVFETIAYDDEVLFVLRYLLEWEDGPRILPFQFVVLETQAAYLQALSGYRNTLWFWLGVVAFSLVLLQLVILKWGFRPLTSLSNNLEQIQRGEATSLEGEHPLEFQEMTQSINLLIEHEAHQRERYRHTLADLAHSIKNPSAIIASALTSAKRERDGNALPWLSDIEEQNERIDQILSYQLTRAVGGVSAPFSKAIAVNPLCEKICSAMKKVYYDKAMELSLDLEGEVTFRGDEGDLMELLGNLIDNAFKYGNQKVYIRALNEDNTLKLKIEDDGPGMSAHERENLIRRGQRADTSIPGQGIGLAVVNDIVESYAGKMTLTESGLGGLCVSLEFSFPS